LITAFSFTTIRGSGGYHSVVWLPDGNTEYFEQKHSIIFIVSLLVLVIVGIPYTVTLTAAPWIQRSENRHTSRLYNRFKPLFDAYMGPYKDSCRYWTGMLLLARVVLTVLFSSIANTNTLAGPRLNLLLLTLSSSGLLALTAALRPYKTRLLNALEVFHLSLLLAFSASNLYVSDTGTGTGERAYIYTVIVGISFIAFLGVCIRHVWHGIRTARYAMKPRLQETERHENRLQWYRRRVRGENERDEVTMTTITTTATTPGGERRDSEFRESVLELETA
jgi:hypothetical protein